MKRKANTKVQEKISPVSKMRNSYTIHCLSKNIAIVIDYGNIENECILQLIKTFEFYVF